LKGLFKHCGFSPAGEPVIKFLRFGVFGQGHGLDKTLRKGELRNAGILILFIVCFRLARNAGVFENFELY